MARSVAHAGECQETYYWNQSKYAKDDSRPFEDDVRFEHQEAANNSAAGFGHVFENVAEQAGLARLRVGSDGIRGNGDALVTGLNDGFHAVAEFGDDIELKQGVLGVCAEVVCRI